MEEYEIDIIDYIEPLSIISFLIYNLGIIIIFS